ncbi:DUF3089 domain-containing protein [Lacihabitans sp. LS3-19]|uniref:DUF3089 domain-containing protein n=1 Tax=Lacihabitans sp. LS3-19 TaxID=2487335 RepID=UPI0020CEA837|nr:DUF3089 domain-containing protein [Lacihabitans sp. LS3-19]MCP9770782.1 DUF3089 domain-containing protein [Lacihabitans sp. LS3-19]
MHYLLKSSIFIFTLLLPYNESIAQNRFIISEKFDDKKTPPKPDFSDKNNWSSRPDLKDMADEIPIGDKNIFDNQLNSKADVFFIYPTIYTKTPNNQYLWNAAVDDNILNKEIDESTIKNQASVFNQSCKIYAPRYRQAHYSVFLTDDKASAKSALDLAYEDVKNAFEYYLKNFNENRPIVIAAHSQGTLHATRLLQDFFDEKPLKKQLVEAYLVGMPVADSLFKEIKLSTSPSETGGYVSWNTFAKDYIPDYYKNGLNNSNLVNPITWTADKDWSNYKFHKGTLSAKFKIRDRIISAKTENGLLWIEKPKVLGKALIKTKIWHFADYNLFWMDIRDNVALRVNNYLK